MVDRQLNSKLNNLELNQMFVDVEKTFSQNAVNASLFFKFASTPIIDESDLLERADAPHWPHNKANHMFFNKIYSMHREVILKTKSTIKENNTLF